MNNKGRGGSYAGWLILGIFIALSVFACKKDGPTKAVVKVLNQNQAPIAGASVTLWQDTSVNPSTGVQSTIRVTKPTDVSGRAEFEFQLESFLNIEVIRGADTGKSFIRLKQHETVEATVHL